MDTIESILQPDLRIALLTQGKSTSIILSVDRGNAN